MALRESRSPPSEAHLMIISKRTDERVTNALALAAFLAMAAAMMFLAGCTKREKVLDIDTPAGSVEVYEEERPTSE
jgi:hypothetical protein